MSLKGLQLHHTKYFLVVGQRWPLALVEDALFNEKNESVTDPELYANSNDEFTPDELITIRFDNRLIPINWTQVRKQ